MAGRGYNFFTLHNPNLIINSYAHIELPRFITVEQLLHVMDAHGVERAIVAGADTCPDLLEVSRAVVEHGDRFRAVGVPLGNSEKEIRASIQHQAESGFLGIRIFDRMLVHYPDLLDWMGELGLTPWVVGSPALEPAAQLLVDFLKRYPGMKVVAPHFAGGGDPGIFSIPGPVKELFDHPNFLVIFSRHGAFESNQIRRWAQVMIDRVGWERILFGSEFPVCLWRNEGYQSTLDWVFSLDCEFSRDQVNNFFGRNALRLFGEKPEKTASIVDSHHQNNNWFIPNTVPLFHLQGIDIPVDLHRQLISHYLEEDESNSLDYRTYVTDMIVESLSKGLRK